MCVRSADFLTEPAVKKANKRAGLAAARPENRKQAVAALADLDRDVLAASTMSSDASRVRFYQEICAAWELEAWPGH